MNPAELLLIEHECLRNDLRRLESLEPLQELARSSLQEVACSLRRRIRSHETKEQFFLGEMVQSQAYTRIPWIEDLQEEHKDHRFTVSLLLDLLTADAYEADAVSMCCLHLIDGLRHHMRTEECLLFPIIEKLLSSR